MFSVFRVNDQSTVPTRATLGSAGYDMYACEEVCVSSRGGRAMISTGVALDFPKDCYCRLAPRSGLAVKSGIDVLAGVVDSDFFPSAIKVVLINHSDEDFVVMPGMRIAQAIFEKIYVPTHLYEISTLGDVESNRHIGFGSTGLS